VGAAVEGGEQALVLVPEIKAAERLVDYLCDTLPDGYAIAAYHSALDRGRGAVYRMARDGEVDVVVGTRPAALLPLRRLGAICLLDEPNEAHRAQPGYEGLQMHARDVVLEREEVEGPGVVLISAFPSLRVYARRDRVRELAARPPSRWPAGRVVDLRGSGAVLGGELISVCRRHLREEKRIALISNRLGYSTSVVCNHCGNVQVCPNCDLPLALQEGSGPAVCSRCGYRAQTANRCAACGSGRVSPTGLGVERLRHEVSRALAAPVGLLTAGQRELEDAPVVVGTARCVSDERWHTVVVADADALLLAGGMGSAERAFRTLYRAAEAAEELVVVQTRAPDHYALRAALQGDYPAFAATELPRLRALGYPPFAHLAALTLRGGEEPVRRAVELHLRPPLEPGVSMSEPVAVPQTEGEPVWRVLLRSPDRDAVARAGLAAARMVVRQRGKNKVKAQVEIDPEEV
jgi:primosomal protein N' (replication factor Y)